MAENHATDDGPAVSMWMAAAALAATTCREMAVEARERAVDLELAAARAETSIGEALDTLAREEDHR
jgi:hypothetical protein